jgi:ribulose-phosphate 3-epimerase
MANPSKNWISDLPKDRLIAEFSVWSGDLVNLAQDLQRVDAFVDVLHVDVADGHFAPAILFFPDLVAGIRKISSRPIHVHLMVDDRILLSQIEQFAEAGSDLISIHVENEAVADEALALIERKGIAAGMVLRVETPIAKVERFVPRLSFLTLLGTAIGVKGQGLDERAGERLQEAKKFIAQSGAAHRIVLAADGGIREHTVPLLRKNGAETVVLGSLAFNAPSLEERMEWLYAL